MSFKNDSELVILNRFADISLDDKAALWETYSRIQDQMTAGPSMGGGGMGKFSSMLANIARMIGGSPFIPTFGSEAINIPGTSYYTPASGGTGVGPGGQAAFGLAPFSQTSGFKTGVSGGGAAPLDGDAGAIAQFSVPSPESPTPGTFGNGNIPTANGNNGEIPTDGMIVGGASPLQGAGTAAALASGAAAGAGFGGNWVLPAAGIVSGVGGMITTLGPFLGHFGVSASTGAAVGTGLSGALLASYQSVSGRILNNADTILANKVKNLETSIKMLDDIQDSVKKMLKDSFDGDKKALDDVVQ